MEKQPPTIWIDVPSLSLITRFAKMGGGVRSHPPEFWVDKLGPGVEPPLILR